MKSYIIRFINKDGECKRTVQRQSMCEIIELLISASNHITNYQRIEVIKSNSYHIPVLVVEEEKMTENLANKFTKGT